MKHQNIERLIHVGQQLEIAPHCLVFKEIIATGPLAHANTNKTRILRQLGQVLFEIRCSNFKATDQPDVTIWIVLHQVEHPLVVWNPFARFDDNRGVYTVLIRHLVEMFGEYWSIQNLVFLRWPRQALRPVGVVQMNVRVDHRDIGTLLVGRTTGQKYRC